MRVKEIKHIFDVEIASDYGVNVAVILENLGFWIKKNEANGTNYYDGNFWTFNSRRALKELFPYLSERQIATALKKMEDEGLITVSNYNKSAYDRTLWYALTEKGKSILQMGVFDADKTECSIMQKCKMEDTEMSNGTVENVTPIPDINTDVTSFVNSDNNYKDDEREPKKPKKEKKPKPKISDFDKVINSYTEDENLKSAIYEFIKMRQLIKKPLTERALELILKKLDSLAKENETKTEILNQSIQNSWQGVFPIKSQPQQQQKEPEKTWYKTDAPWNL